jgi:uncharacterized hydrophobic protein (TIGR00271 family)
MSQRGVPSWINPSTAKGLAFGLCGLLVLVAPGLALPSLRILLAVVLLVLAGINLWSHRSARDSAHGHVRAVLAGLAAVGLLTVPFETLLAVKWVVVAHLAMLGVLALWRSRAQGRAGVPRTDFGRGVMLLASATVILALPHEVLSIAVVMAAAAAVILGLLMVRLGLEADAGASEVTGRAMPSEVLLSWLQERDLCVERRQAIADTLYFDEPERTGKLTAYGIMLALSVTIASFAILQDSTAVVIGAMLIAPLMTPIMGCAAGLVAGWRDRVIASFGLVLVSVVAAIGLAWILASWVPGLVPLEANSQVLSRASPTLLDMAVALAAGAAGAFATTDDRVSQSATGVAIAVALVPPLSVVGVTLEAGRLDWALGAFLLFSTNLVSIIVASALVFVLVGFTPIRKVLEDSKGISDLVSLVAVAAILIMVPLGLSGKDLLQASQRSGAVHDHVAEWLADSSLRLDRVTARSGEATIRLSGSGEVPDIAGLEQALHNGLGERFTVTVEHFPSRILTAGDQGDQNAPGNEVREPDTP